MAGSGASGVSGTAVAATAAGGLLVWSGIKGASVSGVLRDVLSGKRPAALNVNPVTAPAASASATSVPVTATGSSIASDALRYAGHAYRFGGAPGASGTAPWDCSSFCNWVLGHDLGMTLPGSSSPGYSGASHGPTTVSYLTWAGAETVGHTAGAAQAGDLCVWQTHMGICTGPDQMISAQDPALGTGTSSIFLPGEILFVRRIVIGNPGG